MMMIVVDARFLPLTCLTNVIHGLVSALSRIVLIFELVQMCLQPLLILEIILKEDLLFCFAGNECVLNWGPTALVFIVIEHWVFFSATLTTGNFITQETCLSSIRVILR